MTPVNEKEVWAETINQMDVGDRVLGGDDGPINQPIKNLTNRTAYLRALVNAVINEAGLSVDNQNTDLLLQAVANMIMKNNQRQPITAGYDPAKKYQAGDLVKVDSEWYECYHPDGCKGKDPRDPVNRPAGWQNTNQSQPYYWLKIGRWLSFPETGSPIYLPTTAIREGLIKYRNDGNLHKDKFWRLALLYPDLVSKNVINIADLRGVFLRGLDDGRWLDSQRIINSFQNHGIQEHNHYLPTGSGSGDGIWAIPDDLWVACSANKVPADWSKEPAKTLKDGECGDQGNWANETRPVNVAMMIATRI